MYKYCKNNWRPTWDELMSLSRQAGPSSAPRIPIRGRGQPWSIEEKEELMWWFYSCAEQGSTDYRKVFKLWRERNPNRRPNYDANTLQTQRRNIERALTEDQK